MRVIMCNQIFANLLGLFSYAFLPTHGARLQESGTQLGYFCKIIPSLGFIGVTVSISNLACMCVAYYHRKKSGVVLSRGSACLIVINLWFIAMLLTTPLAVSLDSLEITFNNTNAKMCAIVWESQHYEDLYMKYILLFKFLLPLTVISSVCLKVELHFVKSCKIFSRFPYLPTCLVDILMAICLLLLVYFYPLHNACAEKPGKEFLGSSTPVSIIRVLEFIGLVNCTIMPVVLKTCIDEYSDASNLDQGFNKDETKYSSFLPSANACYVTYDALTENTADDDDDDDMTIFTPKNVKILIHL